ncbi:DUF1425 domain-containing protein [Escherichia coli]|nr:DUF1425 domain-containing protein [Escherichia coli]
MAAGISASRPFDVATDIQPSGILSTLYNESASSPITVHYRFYWYDAKRAGDASSGKAAHQRGTIPAHSAVTLYEQRQFSGGAQSQTLSIFVRGES